MRLLLEAERQFRVYLTAREAQLRHEVVDYVQAGLYEQARTAADQLSELAVTDTKFSGLVRQLAKEG